MYQLIDIQRFFVPLTFLFQPKSNWLFLNSKNVDERKRALLGGHTRAVPTDWKQGDCFNEMGETCNI